MNIELNRKQINLEKIESFSKLKDGWGQFGHGIPLLSTLKEQAIWLINHLEVQPEIFITISGNIQMVYNYPEYYFEAVFLTNEIQIFTEFDNIDDEFDLIKKSNNNVLIKNIMDHIAIHREKNKIDKTNLDIISH